MKYEDVEHVEFKISSVSTVRYFEVVIVLKSSARSSVDGKEFAFSGIDKSEFNNLYKFLESEKTEAQED